MQRVKKSGAAKDEVRRAEKDVEGVHKGGEGEVDQMVKVKMKELEVL